MGERRAAEDNERLARRLYELFNARDLDALVALIADDIEWDWSRSIGPDGGDVLHGASEVLRFVQENWEHWESIEMLPEEVVAGGDEVVVFLRVRLRGRDGIEVEARGPHVQTWRDGQLIRYRLFQERAEALAAVGR